LDNDLIFVFETLLAVLLISLMISWASIGIANRAGLIDQPGSAPHKKHGHPVPLAGGISLFLTIVVCAWLFGAFKNPITRTTMLAALPVFVFGLWDDRKNLSPFIKLLGQVFAAILLIVQGVYIQIFESPEFFFYGTSWVYIVLDWLLTIFWVVGITNAFNFVDSMDGLAVGLGGTAASFFLLVTLDSGQYMLAQYSAVLIGICVSLYFFNAPPAIFFLGDSGAQTLGFLLAVLGISYAPQGANQASSWFVPIMLLGVPIFDAMLVIVSRARRRKPIYAAGLDHTYHRLLQLGFHSNRAVLVMQVTSLSLGCLAFVSLIQSPIIANLIFALIVLTGGMTLVILDRRTISG